ncbi:MAG TPA: cytochrome P450 [Pseudonocardiaceae bacterium]
MPSHDQQVSIGPDLPTETEPTQEPAVASIADTLRVLATVLAPTTSIGLIKRRPAAMRAADRFGFDRAAIATLRSLRARYGHRTLILRLPGRSVELPLSADDVGRVLAGTPDPFSASTTEKRAALAHFQPHGVLISRGEARAERRAFNEHVLRPDLALHHLAPGIVDVVREEAVHLDGQLDWSRFTAAWWSVIRRVTLGDKARDDHEITNLLGTLRAAGNWAYLRPGNRAARDRFQRAVTEYVRGAEPGSLAAAVAETSAEPGVDPAGQVPHWLFAFDAAGIVTFRALALLATHGEAAEAAREELRGTDLTQPAQLPYLRACVLESIRLWPTTPALLRETTRETAWGRSGTTSLIFTPFFHRDADTLPYANVFSPRIWLDGTARRNPALVPFSAGPGECPGRNMVLLATSTMLAALLARHDFTLIGKPAIDDPGRLPATLDHTGLRFATLARSGMEGN